MTAPAAQASRKSPFCLTACETESENGARVSELEKQNKGEGDGSGKGKTLWLGHSCG
jgi:hypothetical protein